jgi:hypothetical protein
MVQPCATSRFHTFPVVCELSPPPAVFACYPADSLEQLLSAHRLLLKLSKNPLAFGFKRELSTSFIFGYGTDRW